MQDTVVANTPETTSTSESTKLRIRNQRGLDRVISVSERRTTFGSSHECTVRLDDAPPVGVILFKGTAGLAVRKWQSELTVNDASVDDAWLEPGDIVRFGDTHISFCDLEPQPSIESNENRPLSSDIEAKLADGEDARRRVTSLLDSLQQTQNSLTEYEARADRLDQEITCLKSECETLRVQVAERDARISDLDGQLQSALSHAAQLQDQIDELNQLVSEKTETLDQTQADWVSQAQTLLTRMGADQEHWQEIALDDPNAASQYMSLLNSVFDSASAARADTDMLADLEARNADIALRTQQIDDQLREVEQQRLELQQIRDNLDQTRIELESAQSSFAAEKESWECEQHNLVAQFQSVREAYEQERLAFESHQSEVQANDNAEVEDLRSQLNARDAECETLRAKIEQLQTQPADAHAEAYGDEETAFSDELTSSDQSYSADEFQSPADEFQATSDEFQCSAETNEPFEIVELQDEPDSTRFEEPVADFSDVPSDSAADSGEWYSSTPSSEDVSGHTDEAASEFEVPNEFETSTQDEFSSNVEGTANDYELSSQCPPNESASESDSSYGAAGFEDSSEQYSDEDRYTDEFEQTDSLTEGEYLVAEPTYEEQGTPESSVAEFEQPTEFESTPSEYDVEMTHETPVSDVSEEEELEFSAPSGGSPVDTASILAKFGVAEDVDGESEDTFEAAASTPATPAVDSSSMEMAEQDEPAAPNDDSIEEYMAQLLNRVGGQSTQPLDDDSDSTQTQENVTERVELTSIDLPSETEDELPPLRPEEFVPTSKAPQLDLTSMRSIANETARTAISRHMRKTTRKVVLVQWFLAATFFTAGGIMLLWNTLLASSGAGLSFVIGLYMVLRATGMIRSNRTLCLNGIKEKKQKKQRNKKLPKK